MKEYSTQRVKADFAPNLSDSYDSEEDGGSAEASPTSLKEKDRQRKKRARKARVAIADRKDWNEHFWTGKKKGKKPRYLKQSDRAVKPDTDNPFKKRGMSEDASRI